MHGLITTSHMKAVAPDYCRLQSGLRRRRAPSRVSGDELHRQVHVTDSALTLNGHTETAEQRTIIR